ncbi:MAG: hypothetical protein Q8M79_09970 [Dehalococcoidia bacterium]|nr:hypothetical protein [Dehalococcoidia bacterium]
MLSIFSALLAAQRAPSVTPHLVVRLFDRDLGVPRLRFERWVEGEEPDGPCAAAVPADGALLRARIDPATGALSHQRVETPSASADFDDWTAVGTVVAAARLGLGAAGTRALLATVAVGGVAVEVRESTDSGATFGSPSTVATAGSAVTAVACGVRSDGTAAVVWAAGGVVYEVRRSGTGSWTSAAAWTRSLAAVSGLAMTDSGDWAVAVSGEDDDANAGAWTVRLGSGAGGPPGAWSVLQPVATASPGTGVTYLVTGAAVAGGPRVALVESYDGTASGTGAFDQVLMATAVVGTAWETGVWREPAPFAHASAHGLALAAGGVHAYLGAPDGVWHAEMAEGQALLGDDVVEARYEAGGADGAPAERLRLRLRNDDGRYALGVASLALSPGGEVWFEPGAITGSGAATAAGRVLWITSVRRTREGGRAFVEVEAEGAWGRLARWRAPSQRTWAAGEAYVTEIAAALARRAGVVLAVSGASGTALAHQPAFTLRAGESAATALARLLAKTPDALRARGWTLTLTEPEPDDAVTEAYGTAHPLVAAGVVQVTADEGWVRVFGDGVLGQAIDADGIAAGGGLAVVVDRTLYLDAQAEGRATSRLRQSARGIERAWLRAAPHMAQEAGDVVEVTDTALGLDGAAFRVQAVRLDLARSPRARWEMHLTLGEV